MVTYVLPTAFFSASAVRGSSRKLLLNLLSTTQIAVQIVCQVKGLNNDPNIAYLIYTIYIIVDAAVCAINSICELAESYEYSSKRKVLESNRLQSSLPCIF